MIMMTCFNSANLLDKCTIHHHDTFDMYTINLNILNMRLIYYVYIYNNDKKKDKGKHSNSFN